MQNYLKLELLLGMSPLEIKNRMVITSQKHEDLVYSSEAFTRSVYRGILTSSAITLTQIEYIEFSTGVICIDLSNKSAPIDLTTSLFNKFIAEFGTDVNGQGTLEEINQYLAKGSSIMRYWCFNARHEKLSEEADNDGYGILMDYWQDQLGLQLINIQNLYKNTTTSIT